jgi:hypothetical protein
LGAPQLNLIEALAFVVGVVWLWTQQRLWMIWLAGWLGIGLVSGVLSVDAPHALRTVETIVPTVVIVSAGVYRMIQLVPSRWWVVLLMAFVIGNGSWSATQYSMWQTHPRTQSRFDTVATNDVRFVQQFAQRARAHGAMLYVPEAMRRSDLGVFLLYERGVRVWQGNPATFDPALQHLVLVPVESSIDWPVSAVPLIGLPLSMQARYALWCVGSCTDVAWIAQP